MRYGVVLVVLLAIFASCGTSSPATSPGNSHALPSKGGRTATPAPGNPVEKRETIKFPDGSVDEYVESEWDSTGKKLVKQERFSASGQLVEEIQYTYYDDGPNLSQKSTLDNSNRIKSRVVYRYDSTKDDANLVLEAFVSSKGKQVSAFEYTYDNAGNMLSRIILSASNAKLTETNYNYQNGLIVSSETKDAVRGSTISRAQNRYEGNNLVLQTIYGPTNQITRIIETKWQNGRQVEEVTMSANRQVQVRISNEYGSAGELVRKTIENIEGGGTTQILEYEYSFQQTGRSR